MTFPTHLEVLKELYSNPRACGVATSCKSQSMVLAIIFEWDLDAQQGFFKLMMKFNAIQAKVEILALVSNKVNPHIVNPLTRLWRVINASQLLSHTFLKYVKLPKIAMTHILGLVEGEGCFSSMSFLKSKLRNQLNPHLQLVAMYQQNIFTLKFFLVCSCI
jgi:hypothetical protein